VASVSFDYSGLYLAVAHGNAVSSIVVKEWPDLSLVSASLTAFFMLYNVDARTKS
jgi:hypothetical protein